MRFKDRVDAGEQLAKSISVTDSANTVVLGLPRGGVPLGLIISNEYTIPFDVVLSKKIVHPTHSEVAIGAVAENGEAILNPDITTSQEWITQEVKRVRDENSRRRKLYDEILEHQPLKGKKVIIVDDGIATGMTMLAAIEAVKTSQSAHITVAVPIIPNETYRKLKELVDEVTFVQVPDHFLGAVGAYYQQFPQIKDEEVAKMIKNHKS